VWLDHADWFAFATAAPVTARMGRRWYSRLTRPVKVGASRALNSVGRVLPARAALAFGRGLAHVAFPLDRRRRATLFKNLELAYGDQLDHRARAALGRKVYEHLGQLAIEIVLLRRAGSSTSPTASISRSRIRFLDGDRSQLPIIRHGASRQLGRLGAAALAARGMPFARRRLRARDGGGIGDAVQAFRPARRSTRFRARRREGAAAPATRAVSRPACSWTCASHGNPVMVPFLRA
jgi:hypothetical protein